MGVIQFISRRTAAKTTRAMGKHYRQGLQVYKQQGKDDMAALCRDVIMSRYRMIKPDANEMLFLGAGMEMVSSFLDSALVVVLAEHGVTARTHPDIYDSYTIGVAKEGIKVEMQAHPDSVLDYDEEHDRLWSKFMRFDPHSLPDLEEDDVDIDELINKM
jgi:hypothetical protein